MMKDVFGREVKVGDYIAAGMNYNRSSVLRVGKVIKIKERKESKYSADPDKVTGWSVRVRWTHNGDKDPRWSYGEVEESTILGDVSYHYAKFVILPDGFAEQFPPDVIPERVYPGRG
jgi:hypothetical protein